tara:strand:- start:1097 stop:1327 length:231 start_codon:yes stop_codon:yes gene_type:complete
MKPVLTLDLKTATYSIEHVAPREFVLSMIHKSSISQPEVDLGTFKTQASAKKYADNLESRRRISRLNLALRTLEQK